MPELVGFARLTERGQSSFKTDVTNEEWLLIKALKPVSGLWCE